MSPMLRIQSGAAVSPKPGCSGIMTSYCAASLSKKGVHTGRPPAEWRNSKGAPAPARIILTSRSLTLCRVIGGAMARSSF